MLKPTHRLLSIPKIVRPALHRGGGHGVVDRNDEPSPRGQLLRCLHLSAINLVPVIASSPMNDDHRRDPGARVGEGAWVVKVAKRAPASSLQLGISRAVGGETHIRLAGHCFFCVGVYLRGKAGHSAGAVAHHHVVGSLGRARDVREDIGCGGGPHNVNAVPPPLVEKVGSLRDHRESGVPIEPRGDGKRTRMGGDHRQPWPPHCEVGEFDVVDPRSGDGVGSALLILLGNMPDQPDLVPGIQR